MDKKFDLQSTTFRRIILIYYLSCLVAVALWIADQIFCPYWRETNLELHALWHVAVAYNLAHSMTMVNYAREKILGNQPKLEYIYYILPIAKID
jgi:hypothetical protein